MQPHLSVSLIITTYNWPEALDVVLRSATAQSVLPNEIVIADDGSAEDTRTLITQWQAKTTVPIVHVWHEDLGFRAAMIRNRAIAAASGEYLIFIDGDCILEEHFIAHHRSLAHPGWFVTGNRVLLEQQFTETVLQEPYLPVYQYDMWDWIKVFFQGGCNKLFPLLHLPLGGLRYLCPWRWKGAKTCNLAVFKKDALAVNGFEEAFVGWGYEDSDFVVRLQRQQIYRKNGQFYSFVIHLWHPLQSRASAEENHQRFLKRLEDHQLKATQGVDQYLS